MGDLDQLAQAVLMGDPRVSDVDHWRGCVTTANRIAKAAGLTPPATGVAGDGGPFRAPSDPRGILVEQLGTRWPCSDGRARALPEMVSHVLGVITALPGTVPASGGGSGVSYGPFVPAGIRAVWTATLDGARSRTGAGYNDDNWEYEPKDAKGTRCPVPIDDPTGAGRGTVLSAVIPAGLAAKGRSEVHPPAPNAKAGAVVAWGYDLFIRSLSASGGGDWGGDVITQYGQGGYTPALELKLGGQTSGGQRSLFLDGDSGAWHQDVGAVPVGQWVSVAVRAVISTKAADARLDAWLDGRQVLTDARPQSGTLYPDGKHNPYPKHGLYAAPGRGGEVLYDNVWWGTAA